MIPGLRGKRAGVTLMELLIAVSLVSLISVAAWGGLVYLWTDRHQRLTAAVA